MDERPRLAIVGRPNVGKSTLFNRLLGARKAVVATERGTTRDRLYGSTRWRGRPFTLIDTGGFDPAAGRTSPLAAAVQRHLRLALEDADALILVCDAGAGLLPADELFLEQLRKAGKPVVLAVNKSDHQPVIPPEFYALGVPDIVPVSALHGRGCGELLDAVWRRCGVPPMGDGAAPPTAAAPMLAIVGRPNVGKSSLLNALLREERAIVTDTPGTTRDAVDTALMVRGRAVVLVDTAGLRHRRKVSGPVDLFAMSRSLEAITRCHVALVVLDATQAVAQDDRRIVAQVLARGCGLVLLVNKWDALARGDLRGLPATMARAMPMAADAPALAVSAKTGYHVGQVLPAALAVYDGMAAPRDDALMLRAMQAAWQAHPPPRLRGRPVRLRSVRWRPGRPAAVELGTSPAGRLPPTYAKYLLKRIAQLPGLAGVPVRVRQAHGRG
jgi:GTP-binding protein